MDRKILTASYNTGIGLWTSICVGFSSIFGVVSKNYKQKQEKVLNAANKELKRQLVALGDGYYLIDYRVTWSSKLAVTVSAIAANDGDGSPVVQKEMICPQCGSPIDEEMLFCGVCGRKLK